MKLQDGVDRVEVSLFFFAVGEAEVRLQLLEDNLLGADNRGEGLLQRCCARGSGHLIQVAVLRV